MAERAEDVAARSELLRARYQPFIFIAPDAHACFWGWEQSLDLFRAKRPLLVGTVLFTVTSIALPLMNDIAWFNALRFLQTIGASAGLVVGRAMVRDLYKGQMAAKVMTVLVILLTLGPIASPTMGSLLLEAFGWRSIFATMALISLVALTLSVVILPETLTAKDRQPVPIHNGVKVTKSLLSQRGFVRTALVAGLIQRGRFAFITGSSGVFQGFFGKAPLALASCSRLSRPR